MADNFLHTCQRMRDSSIVLHEKGHWHNACYLGGFVIETYMKLLVSHYTSASPRSYNHNISTISQELAYAFSSDVTLSRSRLYLIPSADLTHTISNWTPHNRYTDNSSAWNESLSINIQNEKEKCFDMLTKMMVDGII